MSEYGGTGTIHHNTQSQLELLACEHKAWIKCAATGLLIIAKLQMRAMNQLLAFSGAS